MDINDFIDNLIERPTNMTYIPIMSFGKTHGLGSEKVCASCGKSFHVANAHLYAFKVHRSKQSDLWFCKWSCMCAYRRANYDKRRKTSKV